MLVGSDCSFFKQNLCNSYVDISTVNAQSSVLRASARGLSAKIFFFFDSLAAVGKLPVDFLFRPTIGQVNKYVQAINSHSLIYARRK